MNMKRFLGTDVGTDLSRPYMFPHAGRDKSVPTSVPKNSYLPQAMELTEEELAAIQGGCLIAIGNGLTMPCGCASPSFGRFQCF